jgi:hypothetical protein
MSNISFWKVFTITSLTHWRYIVVKNWKIEFQMSLTVICIEHFDILREYRKNGNLFKTKLPVIFYWFYLGIFKCLLKIKDVEARDRQVKELYTRFCPKYNFISFYLVLYSYLVLVLENFWKISRKFLFE